MRIGSAILFIGLFVFELAMQQPAVAKDLYSFDFQKQRPELFKAYQVIVPTSLKKFEWFAELAGVSGPLKIGEKYLYGWTCQPHNCAWSYVHFAISVDGKRAFAMFVDSENIQGAVLFAGDPSNIEKIDLLDQNLFR